MSEAGVPPELVVWSDDATDSESEKLALRLGVPLIIEEEPPVSPWILFFEDESLYLHSTSHEGFRPFTIDFLAGDFARRWRSANKNDILAKAIGLKKGVRTVCDATCGLGYDAFFLSTFSDIEMTACERSPVAAELVMDALSRVKETGRFESAPVFFHFGDAIDFLARRPEGFDAVFLDPMYPRDESQTALPKKEMMIFSELVGKDSDAEELFAAAMKAAKSRVVVKRSDDAPEITKSKAPDFVLPGKTVRFDIYLKNIQ